MSNIQASTVLVTGGASGIGRLMVEGALQRGARHLVVWDISEKNLRETVEPLRHSGSPVSGETLDVSDTAAVQQAARRVQEAVGPIDILINNAGVVVGKMFHEHSHRDVERTLSVNTSALMHATLEFLPQMMSRRKGHIVNIASAAGLVSNPRMSVYCASKWAVIGWSESLRLEMERLDTGVRITTVMPYYIATGMFTGVRSLFPILQPEPAAKKILDAVERDKILLSMPWFIHLLPLAKGILPSRVFDWVVGDVLGIYRTMDEFVGHKG